MLNSEYYESRHHSKIQNGQHKQKSDHHTLARQNNIKKNEYYKRCAVYPLLYKEKLPSFFIGRVFHENLMEHSDKLPIFPAAASDVTCKYSTEYDDLKNE
jgi:hypothetical protein